jgi:RecA-family ATPase
VLEVWGIEVMSEADGQTPIQRVLSKLKGVKRSDGGWVACCPAHADKTQSLGIDVVEGKVLLKCHAGCEFPAIVDAMHLRAQDLFPSTPNLTLVKPSRARQTLTLAELCKHKRLPIEFVQGLGWADATGPHGTYVEIPYVRRDGTVHRTRLRVALSAKEGSRWGAGEGQIAYDPDKGALAAQEQYLVVCEGESDTVTLLLAGIPALGVPGANAPHVLEREHLEGLKCVFVVRETDAAGDKFVAGITERITELGIECPVHPLSMPNAAKDPSALYIRDPEKFAELVHGAMVEASKPPPEPLDDVWKTLGQWNLLTEAPPARRWLLERPDDECNGARNIGVLPLGKVGMLVSAGGVGKTMALCQLALSIATGRKWLDYYHVCQSGRVLLALGEEDREEIWRRMFQAAHAMRLTDAQLELASNNIVAMPLAGRTVALVEGSAGVTTPTPMLEAIRKRLNAEQGWKAIVMDPLSRFAGVDTEKDNSAATRFVEVAESLVQVPGGPSVLLAHHTNKTSRTDGSNVNAAHARGASGLTDGVRWVANLESREDGNVNLEVTKSNYAPRGPSVTLLRDPDHGGYLRVQSQAERTQLLEQATERGRMRITAMRDLVIKTIGEHPGLKSFEGIFRITRGKRNDVHAAFHDLLAEGWIERSKEGLKLSERSGLND